MYRQDIAYRRGHQDGRDSDFRSRSLRNGLSKPSIDLSPALRVVMSFVHSLYFRRSYRSASGPSSPREFVRDLPAKRHALCLQNPHIEPYISPRLMISDGTCAFKLMTDLRQRTSLQNLMLSNTDWAGCYRWRLLRNICRPECASVVRRVSLGLVQYTLVRDVDEADEVE
jgi:hypothetical protein